ncbi:serine/threonine-protein kinase Nek4 isoform X1 [Labeo rohita]|uniref:serine/threonine-protein kinase Nek4 isoform X1 n=1 Tax=Labeo rohita TaxID=84645 RepID=UPI0021E26C11|nr:serine/threonine-protein kinase Nek4 isoform X1 [Labeo rohita]XP_050978440.1 serine/threonine-protein kinase Nek4 isoform X1 [Labeo rohita]
MDSYLFVRVVGKGSYGEVNLVRHRSDRKQYVIKKLNLRTSSRRERRAAEQEAQLLSQLKHPNIVTYRESWEGEDCQLYIVMGFCEGGDLYHRLKQQKGELLPERQVVEWFVQIAMALQYLHEKHILHRDLKTQNIFLTKTNIIKVGDLGIARVLENQNDMASTLIGTPYYMSPELFSNKPYNYKSDVWALGCCVYEMSTLKHAFNAKDMNSLVYRIVEGKLPQMPSKYDPQLGELIKRMLCKKPEDRPDVKHILRQPYIKQQISMFLEATKEKTAKSRKNAANSKAISAESDASAKPNHEVQPQCLNSESKTRGKKVEENHLNRHKLCNGAVEKVAPNPHLPPRSPSRDILNSTGRSTATISNIDIEIQTQEPKQRKAKPPQPKPSSHQNHKPPSVSKRRDKDEKEDPGPPQTRLTKQVLDVGTAEDKMSANDLVSQNSTAPKPADRTKMLSKSKALDVSMDLKDDTMKLLQEAGMEDVPREPIEQHHNKSERQRTSTAGDDDHSSACVLKDAPTGSSTEGSEGSLDSTDKLLKPVPVILMEPSNSESTPALSDQSRPVVPPSSSSSEPSMSRQRRQRKKEKSLDDQNSHQVKAVPRPLPPLPEHVLSVNSEQKGHSEKNRAANLSSSTSNSSEQQNRPLSARERRRLKQLQENSRQQAVSAVKRVLCDVPSLDGKQTDQLDCPRPASAAEETKKERKCSWRQSDDDECSSSTSSTERSEGDYRERKCETTEMQDLVQMMTQTLHMDARDVSFEPDGPRCLSTPLPEFKLNRKYRDTLMLHGKSRESQGDFQISGFPLDDSTGPAKVRRVIEHLRTDVVKGLGVKLLDRVLDIMQEDDEDKREHLLQEQMGEEKYKQYAMKVQQLKFFEDVAVKD